jgi:hypothetical protein
MAVNLEIHSSNEGADDADCYPRRSGHAPVNDGAHFSDIFKRLSSVSRNKFVRTRYFMLTSTRHTLPFLSKFVKK